MFSPVNCDFLFMTNAKDPGKFLQLTESGLYCPEGDFYIDPWQPVDRALVTHAHSDHARWGCKQYLAAAEGLNILRVRLGKDADIQSLPFGETVQINQVKVSFHPAGHILGSSQIRLEHCGEVWVVSGDYKVEPDNTCTPFEPVRCHTFVTESTFGLPIYRWPEQKEVFANINSWWRKNQEAKKASLLFGYALGKSQRLLAGVDEGIGPIFTHGAVEKLCQAYRAGGVKLPQTYLASSVPRKNDWSRSLVLAPPSAHGSPWMRKFGATSTAFASGWMQIRGTRRRRAVDRGFVLSDHADWPGLLDAIKETGAERVWATHGYTAVLVRWLREQGMNAWAVKTRFQGETDDASEEESAEEVT